MAVAVFGGKYVKMAIAMSVETSGVVKKPLRSNPSRFYYIPDAGRGNFRTQIMR
jgi:hypothetical protein